MAYETLRYEQSGHVVTLTYDRPEQHNSPGECGYTRKADIFKPGDVGYGGEGGVGRTLEERLRIEAEQTLSMFMRRDSHTIGAAAFKAGDLSPEWPHHGL